MESDQKAEDSQRPASSFLKSDVGLSLLADGQLNYLISGCIRKQKLE